MRWAKYWVDDYCPIVAVVDESVGRCALLRVIRPLRGLLLYLRKALSRRAGFIAKLNFQETTPVRIQPDGLNRKILFINTVI